MPSIIVEGGGGAANAFVQSGNSFSAAAILGTNDANSLSFETNNVTRWTFADTTGLATFTATSTATSGTEIALSITPSYSDGGVNSTTIANVLTLAPTFNYTGASRTGRAVGLYINPTNTSLPTGTNGGIALSLTAATLGGFQMYGTADETTNWERVEIKRIGNDFAITSNRGGVGTIRAMIIGTDVAGNNLIFRSGGTNHYQITNAAVFQSNVGTDNGEFGQAGNRIRNLFLSRALDIVQIAMTSANQNEALSITGGIHTGLTASTEQNDIRVDLSRTVQFATGNFATQRAIYIDAPTYGFVGASTITVAATCQIDGSPVAWTNATLTTSLAFWVTATGATGSFNTYFGATPSMGGGIGVIGIADAGTNPSSNPTGGGILYSNAGAGTWRGSGGSITAFGPAGPHCGECGYDSWTVAMINSHWKAWCFICGHCGKKYAGGPQSTITLLSKDQKKELLNDTMDYSAVSYILGIR